MMIEIINGVKNIKNINIGKGLTSNPIVHKASGLNSTPVVNKKGGKIIKKKKTICQRIKNFRIKIKYYIIIYNERINPNY